MKGFHGMRLMIDTNIVLDVLLEREPFCMNSRAVLDLCESKKQERLPDLWYCLYSPEEIIDLNN